MRFHCYSTKAVVAVLGVATCLLTSGCGKGKGVAKYKNALCMVRPEHDFVIKVDVAKLLDSKFVKSFPDKPDEMLKKMAGGGSDDAKLAKFVLDIEMVWIAVGAPSKKGAEPKGVAVYLRLKNPDAVKKFVKMLDDEGEKGESAKHDGKEYFKPVRKGKPAVYIDEREIYLSEDVETIHQVIDDKGSLPDTELIKKLSSVDFSARIVMAGPFASLKKNAARDAPPQLAKAAKAAADIDFAVIAIDPDGKKVVDIDLDMDDADAAETLEENLNDGLKAMKKQLADAPSGQGPPGMAEGLAVAKGLLKAVEVERSGKHLDITLNRTKDFDKIPDVFKKATAGMEPDDDSKASIKAAPASSRKAPSQK